MVTSKGHPLVHTWVINSQQREVSEAATARNYLPPRLLAKLDWLFVDEVEYDSFEDLRDLEGRIGQ